MSLKSLGLRIYPDPVPSLCEQWFDEPCQSIEINKLGDFSLTTDGACRVSFGDGVIGFVKPRPDSQNTTVVANEKIAADLGHLLHLPAVPIVVRNPMADWPIYSALSLACLPQGRHWEQGPQFRPSALDDQLEALRVFWTWIGDVDHGGHPQNLIYEFDGSVHRLAAIDHSYAFGHGGADPLTAPVSIGYGTADMAHVASIRVNVVDAIMSLDWAEVDHIFRRLPVDLLTEDDAKAKLEWVANRKENLCSLLSI
jgi:hypothetical protein